MTSSGTRSASDGAPTSAIDRSSSACSSSTTRCTPPAPPAARPYICERPIATASAPNASAFDTSVPRRDAAIHDDRALTADRRDDLDEGVERRDRAIELPPAVVRDPDAVDTPIHCFARVVAANDALQQERDVACCGADPREVIPAEARARDRARPAAQTILAGRRPGRLVRVGHRDTFRQREQVPQIALATPEQWHIDRQHDGAVTGRDRVRDELLARLTPPGDRAGTIDGRPAGAALAISSRRVLVAVDTVYSAVGARRIGWGRSSPKSDVRVSRS